MGGKEIKMLLPLHSGDSELHWLSPEQTSMLSPTSVYSSSPIEGLQS